MRICLRRNLGFKAHGFSLTEMLVVIAIIVGLMLLAAPAFDQMAKGSRLTIAGNLIVDQLRLAQQTATTYNLPVEVRFYKLTSNKGGSTGPQAYRAMQTFLIGDTEKPLTEVLYLPGGVILYEDAGQASLQTCKSSLFLKTGGPVADPEKLGTFSIPNHGTNYKYTSFRFRGNGETDLNETPATFFSLAGENEIQGSGELPANFVTLQIDPVSGSARTYRP